MTATPLTITWTEWAVGWPCPGLTGNLWDLLPYDDEQDARDHLAIHGPDAFLIRREVAAAPWRKADQ